MTPLWNPLSEGVLEGMSGSSQITGEGACSRLREAGREALAFSGMGAAVFDGVPALEAVHFESSAGGTGEVWLW